MFEFGNKTQEISTDIQTHNCNAPISLHFNRKYDSTS